MEQDIEPYIAGSREHHNQPLEDRLMHAVTAMQHRMQTAEGKAIYSKRKATVETVFGVIKDGAGIPALSTARVTRRRGRMESARRGI